MASSTYRGHERAKRLRSAFADPTDFAPRSSSQEFQTRGALRVSVVVFDRGGTTSMPSVANHVLSDAGLTCKVSCKADDDGAAFQASSPAL